METISKIGALKEFFGASGRTVENSELMALRKADPEGFTALAQAAAAALGKRIGEPVPMGIKEGRA